jgi:hypothetical protein
MKRKLMSIILSYSCLYLSAQTPNSIGLPSPNNSFLGSMVAPQEWELISIQELYKSVCRFVI